MHKAKVFFTKLLQWEHWPTFMFYIPLIPYYIFSAIKAKNLVFYLAANPGIKYSGNGTESKYKTIQLLPENYTPKTIFIANNESFNKVLSRIEISNIYFPMIIKPDIGFRGYLVQKINSEIELKKYLKKNSIDLIIQEFIMLDNECGVFYHRNPGEETGKITSITLKKFLTVIGDGSSNLEDLILNNKRAFLYYDLLKNIHKEKMNNIPEKGEAIKLTVIGNHSKGTQFINGNYLINNELEKVFDRIAKQIKGWYYGRLDIKFDSFENLKQGKNIKILEVNGIISEPTHIYDPTKTSYFGAIRSIYKHWKILKKIAITNHIKYNIAYPKVIPYLKDMLWLSRYSKKLKRLNSEN